LGLITQKKQAQEQAYKDAIADIERQEILPEVAETRKQAESIKNRMILTQLDADAARTRLEGEKKVTEELKRQVEVRKQYQQKTEDLNLETDQILGLISEQEAKLQKLYLDWQRAKEEAIKAGGYTPEYAAALDRNYRAKALDSSYLGQRLQAAGQILTSAFGDLANTIFQGGTKLSAALDAFGKKLLQDTFKTFFEDLGKAITQGIKKMASEIIGSLQGGEGGGFFSGIWGWFKGLFGGGESRFDESGVAIWGDVVGSAHGNVFSQGLRLAAFGSGGIFTRPTIFPMANGGLGLAGEDGEEAILPLERIRGDLGVKARISSPPNVTVINNTGVEATPSISQGDDGDLLITLDKALAGQVAKGGKLKQIIQAIARGQI
jgi:phage-related minor tail protein